MRITTYRVELNDERLNILVKESGTNYPGQTLNNPESIVKMLNDLFYMDRLAEERIYVLAMDKRSHPVGVFLVSKGTVSASVLTPREVFIRLLLCGATSFVIIHNHPSGDPTPSNDDRFITKRFVEVSKMVGIAILDHIVIGDGVYWSFKEHGDI